MAGEEGSTLTRISWTRLSRSLSHAFFISDKGEPVKDLGPRHTGLTVARWPVSRPDPHDDLADAPLRALKTSKGRFQT